MCTSAKRQRLDTTLLALLICLYPAYLQLLPAVRATFLRRSATALLHCTAQQRHTPFTLLFMSGAATQPSISPAGAKRRNFSSQGGLLGRMFGSNNDNGKEAKVGDSEESIPKTTSPQSSPAGSHIDTISESKDEVNDIQSPTKKSPDESNSAEKRRRSSGVGRARELFSSAKQSLHSLGSPDSKSDKAQTPMQKLGKIDPALSVPQGSQNNSAGESIPGPRSTFRVGVTEDKNKKCRRTMEDTHAYLYNFLSTPAPQLGADALEQKRNSEAHSANSTMSDQSKEIVETDNGYFAIFDGHAGTFAADWCGKKVHILLEETIRKHPNTPIPELLDTTFTSVDQQLEKLPVKNSGCTAVIAVLRWEDRVPNSHSATGSTAIAPAAIQAAMDDSHGNATRHEAMTKAAEAPHTELKLREQASRQRVLYTANVGDARIVLCRNGKALRLSYDHKGSDENEGRRISGAGGLILNNRVNGVLAVTRALGDAYMKDLVTGHPYTTETVIQPDIDEFLILACDGVSEDSAPRRDRVLTFTSFGMFVPIRRRSTWPATSKTRRRHRGALWSTHSHASPPTISRVWSCGSTEERHSKLRTTSRMPLASRGTRRASKAA